MDDMEKLARWHDGMAVWPVQERHTTAAATIRAAMADLDELKTQLKTVLYREADSHHLHDAIVDALEAENARLRGPVTQYVKGYGPGDGDSAIAAQDEETPNE